MAIYIYLPVPGPQMISLSRMVAKTLGGTVISATSVIARRSGHGCLARLHPSDTLFIFTHGAGRADTATIAAKQNGWLPGQRQTFNEASDHWEGGVFKAFTTEQLAEDLRQEGLPLNFMDVRVLACGGGYAGTLSPWVARFCTKLARTHVFVEVTGYQGFVHISPGSIRVEDKSGGSNRFYSLDEMAIVYRSGFAQLSADRGRSSLVGV